MNPILYLYPIPPYDFEKIIGLLRRYAYPSMDRVHGAAYRRVFAFENQPVLVEINSEGTVEQPVLQVKILAGEAEAELFLPRVVHVMGVHENRAAFFAHSDAKLQEILMPVYGLPDLRTDTVFEALMMVIIEQQIAWKAAQRAQQWLVRWGGREIEYQSEKYHAFPTPEKIAMATVDDLKPLKITFRRMALMIHLAQEMVNGRLDLENLSRLPPQEAYHALMQVKGIGHWTAAVIVGRAFGYKKYLTHNDVALQAAANRYFYGQKGRLSPEKLVETLQVYGDFAGDAAYYTLLRWVFDEYPVL